MKLTYFGSQLNENLSVYLLNNIIAQEGQEH